MSSTPAKWMLNSIQFMAERNDRLWLHYPQISTQIQPTADRIRCASKTMSIYVNRPSHPVFAIVFHLFLSFFNFISFASVWTPSAFIKKICNSFDCVIAIRARLPSWCLAFTYNLRDVNEADPFPFLSQYEFHKTDITFN